MKKEISLSTVLLVFISFLSLPTLALATSGACSGHGGVNCAAEAGAYGQVICNDGWEGSSVSYASMVECQSTQPSIVNTCTPPTATGCTQQFEYTQLQNLCTQQQAQAQTYCSRQSAYLGAYGGNANAPCTPPSTSACTQAAACQSQITAYNAAEQTYNACVANYTQQVQQASNNQIQQTENQLQQSATQAKQLSLDASCGTNETYDQTTNQCECAVGYVNMNRACMTPDQAQVVQEVNAKLSAQAAQESADMATPTVPNVTPPNSQKQNTPSRSRHVSGIVKLITEAKLPATTSPSDVPTTTPPSTMTQKMPQIHPSFLEKIFAFFVHLLAF